MGKKRIRIRIRTERVEIMLKKRKEEMEKCRKETKWKRLMKRKKIS